MRLSTTAVSERSGLPQRKHREQIIGDQDDTATTAPLRLLGRRGPSAISPSVVSLGLMVVATALLAATSVMAKAVGTGVAGGPDLHPLQISAGRFGFAFIALAPFLIARWPGTDGLAWRLHIGRVLCGWSGVTFLFAAATRLPLADANAISFLSPAVTMILSVLILREYVGLDRWAAAAVSFLGALVLTRPGTSAFQLAALLAAMSALLIGAELIFIKILSGTERPLRILAMSNGIGAMISIAVSVPVWTTPVLAQWLILALLGVTMLSAQVLFIQANRRSDASFLAPIFYAVPLFAALYDYAIYGQTMTVTSGIGIALIIAGAVLLAVRTSLGTRRAAR